MKWTFICVAAKRQNCVNRAYMQAYRQALVNDKLERKRNLALKNRNETQFLLSKSFIQTRIQNCEFREIS